MWHLQCVLAMGISSHPEEFPLEVNCESKNWEEIKAEALKKAAELLAIKKAHSRFRIISALPIWKGDKLPL